MSSFANGPASAWAAEGAGPGATAYGRPFVGADGAAPRPTGGAPLPHSHSYTHMTEALGSDTSYGLYGSRGLPGEPVYPHSPHKPNHASLRPATQVLFGGSPSGAMAARQPTYESASRAPTGTMRRSAFRTTDVYMAHDLPGGTSTTMRSVIQGDAPPGPARYDDASRPPGSETLRGPGLGLHAAPQLPGTSSLLERGATYVAERSGRLPTSTLLLYAQQGGPRAPPDSTRTQLHFPRESEEPAADGHANGNGSGGFGHHNSHDHDHQQLRDGEAQPRTALRPGPYTPAPGRSGMDASASAAALGARGAGESDGLWRTSRLSERIEERLQRARQPAAVVHPAGTTVLPDGGLARSGRIPPATAEGRREQRGASDRVGEAISSNLRLHDELAERNAYIQKLNEGCTILEERIRVLREEREQCDAATRALEDRLEEAQRKAEIEKNVLIEKRDALQNELEAMALELRSRDAEIEKLKAKVREHEDYAQRSAHEARQARDEIGRYVTDRDHWAREATQLAKRVEELQQQSLAQAADSDAKIKSIRMQMHELESQLAAANVEKQTAVASKVDLIEDLNRLNRRLSERDAQVAKLTRLLEQREQTIAELGPAARESARLSRLAKSGMK